jgi:hypothetical protein
VDDFWKLLTILIGVLVWWIAYEQWHVNREGLRLDLFDKRHAVFAAVRDFIVSIEREGRVDPNG